MQPISSPIRLDALVNNAAIGSSPGDLAHSMAETFRTNATGPILMVEAFAALLQKAHGIARVVNVTSGAGSITSRLNPSSLGANIKAPEYRTSKAALNMVSAVQMAEYGGDKFKVFLFCPGFTANNLSPMNKEEHGAKPTSAGARPMVGILKGERDKEAGGILHEAGQYPW